MPDQVVQEVAEIEFERFASAWRIDTEIETMNEESAEGFEDLKRKLIRRIRSGLLTVDEGGEVITQTLEFPKTDGVTELAFKPPGVRAMLAWDRMKERQGIAKLNSTMAAMCGQNPAVFSQMDGRDWKVPQAIASLFLAS